MPPQRMTPEQRKAHVAEQRARKLAEQIAASEARVDRIWRGLPPEPVTYAKQVADKEGNGKAPEFKPAENKLPDGVALDDFQPLCRCTRTSITRHARCGPPLA